MSRTRSPGYPNYSLGEAVARIRKVFISDRRNPIDREVVAKHIGYSGLSGAADKSLATLMHFDLLERVAKGEVRVSQLAVDILHPDTEEQKKKALLQAAFAPDLFKTLKERFPDDQFSDDALRSYLMRLNFLPRAIEPVVKAYTGTCSYLAQSRAYENGSPLGVLGGESQDEDGEDEFVVPADEPARTPPPPKAPVKEVGLMHDERVLTIGMLSKHANFRLVVSGPVGIKEIERLIQKLELDKEILAEEDERDDGEKPKRGVFD